MKKVHNIKYYELTLCKGNLQIFSEFGLNPLTIGKRRIKTCTRNWKKQALHDPTFSKSNYHPIHKETDIEKTRKY